MVKCMDGTQTLVTLLATLLALILGALGGYTLARRRAAHDGGGSPSLQAHLAQLEAMLCKESPDWTL